MSAAIALIVVAALFGCAVATVAIVRELLS